ncbi:MAG TPA: MurR/RpiR family transcriptional regulator [Sporolactobacillaceae bacterium]|nr:MurR/RpiR family transcriptional regulator [Sporolactobacillaceae bacterium]
MLQSSCLQTIKTNYNRFSKAEKLVADYVLASPDKIIHQSISEVADDLNVANSTVFRFCKAIGFKGYQAMKIALASEIVQPIASLVEEKITAYDTEQQITEKIFNTTIRNFKETIQAIDFSSLKKAVNVIVNAEKVEFYGLGSSSLVALDAHYKFIGTGLTTTAYTDLYLQKKAASQLTNKDVAIFLADQAYSESLAELLELSKASGATTVGVTPFSPRSLELGFDVLMNMGAEEGEYTRLVQMSLVDALYANVMKAREGFLKNSIKKLKSYLVK